MLGVGYKLENGSLEMDSSVTPAEAAAERQAVGGSPNESAQTEELNKDQIDRANANRSESRKAAAETTRAARAAEPAKGESKPAEQPKASSSKTEPSADKS